MPLTAEMSVLAAIGVCLAGALLTLAASPRRTLTGWLAVLVTTVGALLAGSAAVRVLTAGPGHPVQFLQLPKLGFALRLYVDGLTSVFLLLAATISVPVAVYSVRYLAHRPDGHPARYYPHFLVFLAAMYGLVSTTDMMWFFFIFWQMMTIPGYALIRFDRGQPAHRIAARKYLVMMQIACAATMIGAQLLTMGAASATGSPTLAYDFDTVSEQLPAFLRTHPALAALAFALFLVGFGIKMGMWPFGRIWLPDAHPAAPSPVSAMLSGVMIKTGVYGLARYFLWLVPADGRDVFPLAGWGVVIAVLGTVTLASGTTQALFQEQSKRLLAFSSIGQVGYLLLGLGTAMILLARGSPALAGLAALAVLATLFHVLVHGLLKALLFLNAGSVLQATGTQDLSRLGGLLARMPITAATAFAAAFGLAGLPLFAGYASKWGLYVSAIGAGREVWFLPVCGAVAILTSALSLAVALKFVGAMFLGRTSSAVHHAGARTPPDPTPRNLEVALSQRAAQVFLALVALALGLFPAAGLDLVTRALAHSRQGYGELLAAALPPGHHGLFGLDLAARGAVIIPLAIAAVLGTLFLLALALARLGGAARRRSEPWLCGYAREAEVNRYPARSLARELGRLIGARPPAPVNQPHPGPSPAGAPTPHPTS